MIDGCYGSKKNDKTIDLLIYFVSSLQEQMSLMAFVLWRVKQRPKEVSALAG